MTIKFDQILVLFYSRGYLHTNLPKLYLNTLIMVNFPENKNSNILNVIK